MKHLFILALLPATLFAANPSFQQFDTNTFVVVDKVSIAVNTNRFTTTNDLSLKLDASNGVATGTHNFTNAMIRFGAKPTNWNSTVVGSYSNLVVGTNYNTGGFGADILVPAGSGLRWLVGGIWNFSDHDASGDELIIDGSPHIALIPGNVTDTFPGRTQLGAGGPGHDWLMVNHDNPTSSTDIGNTWSKSLGFLSYSFVDSTLRQHMPGIQGFSYRTNVVTAYPYSEGELRFYSAIPQWFGLWNQDVEPNAPGLETFRAGPYGIKINASVAGTGFDISGNGFPTLTFSTNKWKFYQNLSADWFFLEHTANGTSPFWINNIDVISLGVSGKAVNMIGPVNLAEGISGNGSGLTSLTAGYVVGSFSNGVPSLKSNLVAPVSITVGPDPFTWTNDTGVNVYVFIDVTAATVSGVDINGQNVFGVTSGNTIPLQPGETVAVHYSAGTPGMRYKPF